VGEQGGDRFRRERVGEEESLPSIAPEPARLGCLFLGFDALGYDQDVECVGHVDDRCHNRGAVAVCQIADQRAVDLQLVDLESRQGGERGVAGTEVLERDADAQVAVEIVQRGGQRWILDRRALG
jgi:hypothetical protein